MFFFLCVGGFFFFCSEEQSGNIYITEFEEINEASRNEKKKRTDE
jgi:hypothetical protein